LKLSGSSRGDLLCTIQVKIPVVPAAERDAIAEVLRRLEPLP
jgi:hypothetical protein